MQARKRWVESINKCIWEPRKPKQGRKVRKAEAGGEREGSGGKGALGVGGQDTGRKRQ